MASLLGRFVALETFELYLGDSLSMPIVDVREKAGCMGRLSSWTELAPSLESVVIYGIKLD